MKSRPSIFFRIFMRSVLGLVLLAGLFVGGALTSLAARAQPDGTTYTISDCSSDSQLQTAITNVNNDGIHGIFGDTIKFTCSGDIKLTATLDINNDLVMDATGQSVTLDGNNSVGVLNSDHPGQPVGNTISLTNLTIANGKGQSGNASGFQINGGNVTITNSTFTNNSVDPALTDSSATVTINNSSFTNNTGVDGGAIENFSGTLHINNSTVTGNSVAPNGGTGVALGGGIYSNIGSTTITNSTIANNKATSDSSSGGGGVVSDGASTTITDSTFANNSSTSLGGGLLSIDGGTFTISNSTFANNSASQGGAFYDNGNPSTISNSTFAYNTASNAGGALYQDGANLNLNGNIVASNTGSNCAHGNTSVFTDQGYNLSDDSSCNFTASTSQQNFNAQLASGLASNGGPTQTIALINGSPAIDQIPVANCPATDQRGSTRPDDSESTCDIGAYESNFATTVDDDLALTNMPANITVPATGDQGAVVTYTNPTAKDEADGGSSPTVGCSPASGSTFAAGTTTVTCSATDSDDSNSPVTGTFTVTVTDKDMALTNMPANITTPATSAQGAAVTYTNPTATDEDGSSPAVSCNPASGSTFVIGTTTVTCSATDSDDSNSPVTGTFTVTVTDKDLALTGMPSDITVQATSAQGAVVTYTNPTTTDEPGDSSSPSVSCNPASGSTFPIGTTRVTCTATDSDDSNSPVTGSFNVIVTTPSFTITDCSSDSQLQSAISAASSGEVITFSCSGDIKLSKTLTIATSLTLDGSGQSVTLDGQGSVQILVVNGGVTFTLNSLTIAHGFSETNGEAGGGLESHGTTIINDSTFTSNSASFGGGIDNADGTMTITNSTFTNNTAALGGGVYNAVVNFNSGTITIINSTFANNSTPNGGSGAGVFVNGGTVNITNSTFANNAASGNGSGGGVFRNNSSTLHLTGSILAGNAKGNCSGGLSDGGYNFSDDTSCGFTASTSQQNVNPQLVSGLANNGGPTQTIALLSSSPAIDQIPAASCPSTDQRGSTRPDNGENVCDSGAYEFTDAADNDLALTNVPSNITVPSTSSQGAVVTYTNPTATDEAGDNPGPSVSCNPASGSVFPVGTTTVTCTATDSDDSNSPVTGTFTVTVTDDDLALTNVPADITVNATSAQGASVTYTAPTATDEDGSSPAVSCSPTSGSTFAIGTTTVTCTASDSDDTNSPVSATFKVTVVDNLPPSLQLPTSPVTVGATSAQGAVVTYTVTATDPVYPANQLTITCTPASGSTFPVGNTTVNCSASDPASNSTTGSFTVTVTDSDLALTNVPANITVNATSSQGAIVTYTAPTAADEDGSSLTVVCSPVSGSTFAIGTTTVNCSVSDSDDSNSPATASFTVTVSDTDLAITNVPANITVDATSSQGAKVTYTQPTATDEGGDSPTASVSCDHASGSTFPIGTTTVTCMATDSDDLNSPVSATFMVTVNDTDLALTNVPANITTNATSSSGAVVTYTAPTAVDEESPPTVSCNPASGSIFPIGTTTVTCTASDSDDTDSPVSATFMVTVNDTDLAITNMPANISADATSAQGAVVTYTAPTATDEGGETPPVSCNPASGSTFPIGATRVTCTATDSDDTPGTVSGSFTVTVVDKLPPVLQLPGSPVTANATSAQGAAVSYTVTATDPVYPSSQLTINCIPASGSTFPIGNTTVNCTVTDPVSNSASGSFTVTVVDKLPPVLYLPSSPVTVNATSPQGATVNYTVMATDPVYSASQLTIMCSPASGSTFLIGTTTVNCTVIDPANNSASGSFQVVVNGASAQVNETITLVNSFHLPGNVQNSFDSQLQTVQADLTAKNTARACSDLTGFINHVKAQSGKQLTVNQANQLIAAAKQIQTVIGC